MEEKTNEEILDWAIKAGIAVEENDSISQLRSLRKLSLETAELARKNNEALSKLSASSKASILSALRGV